MFLTLSRSYETMRVEETNDVAAITVIDRAVPPVRRSYPSRRTWALVTLAFTFTACVTLALVLDWLESLHRLDAEVWEDLRARWRQLVADLRRRPSFRRPWA
jgi:uncharacterized protein involved in exopolysaccharide biosynthesis